VTTYRNFINIDAVILIPSEVWTGDKIQLRFMMEKLVPYITEEYNIDVDKISISGHSSAAGHSIFTAVWYPNSFSAIVPISLCRKDTSWIPSLVKTKFWIFHGDKDTVCSKSSGNDLSWWLTSAGGYSRFTVVKSDHGGTPFKAFKDYDPVNWMIKQTRGQPVVY
jgi:predicted peptidase